MDTCTDVLFIRTESVHYLVKERYIYDTLQHISHREHVLYAWIYKTALILGTVVYA